MTILMLSEVSQSGKAKNMWDTKLKLIDTDKSVVITRGKGVGGVEEYRGGQIYGDGR